MNEAYLEYSLMSDIYDAATEGLDNSMKSFRLYMPEKKKKAPAPAPAPKHDRPVPFPVANAKTFPGTSTNDDSTYSQYMAGGRRSVPGKIAATITYIFKKLIAFIKKVAARFANFFKALKNKNLQNVKRMNATSDMEAEMLKMHSNALRQIGNCLIDSRKVATSIVMQANKLDKSSNIDIESAIEKITATGEKMNDIRSRFSDIMAYVGNTTSKNIAKYSERGADLNGPIDSGTLSKNKTASGTQQIILRKAIEIYGRDLDAWFVKTEQEVRKVEEIAKTQGGPDLAAAFSGALSNCLNFMNEFTMSKDHGMKTTSESEIAEN